MASTKTVAADSAAKHATSSLEYESDFNAWTAHTANLLRQGQFVDVDIEHVAEEIEALGRSDKRALASHLKNVLLHLLKWQFEPHHRGSGWRLSIRNSRQSVNDLIEESPSLKPFLAERVDKQYRRARVDAADETGLPETTFPADCPYSLDEIQDERFLPN